MYYLFVSEERKECLILTKELDITKVIEIISKQFKLDRIEIKDHVLESKKWELTLAVGKSMEKLPVTHLQNLVCSGGTVKKEEW